MRILVAYSNNNDTLALWVKQTLTLMGHDVSEHYSGCASPEDHLARLRTCDVFLVVGTPSRHDAYALGQAVACGAKGYAYESEPFPPPVTWLDSPYKFIEVFGNGRAVLPERPSYHGALVLLEAANERWPVDARSGMRHNITIDTATRRLVLTLAIEGSWYAASFAPEDLASPPATVLDEAAALVARTKAETHVERPRPEPEPEPAPPPTPTPLDELPPFL